MLMFSENVKTEKVQNEHGEQKFLSFRGGLAKIITTVRDKELEKGECYRFRLGRTKSGRPRIDFDNSKEANGLQVVDFYEKGVGHRHFSFDEDVEKTVKRDDDSRDRGVIVSAEVPEGGVFVQENESTGKLTAYKVIKGRAKEVSLEQAKAIITAKFPNLTRSDDGKRVVSAPRYATLPDFKKTVLENLKKMNKLFLGTPLNKTAPTLKEYYANGIDLIGEVLAREDSKKMISELLRYATYDDIAQRGRDRAKTILGTCIAELKAGNTVPFSRLMDGLTKNTALAKDLKDMFLAGEISLDDVMKSTAERTNRLFDSGAIPFSALDLNAVYYALDKMEPDEGRNGEASICRMLRAFVNGRTEAEFNALLDSGRVEAYMLARAMHEAGVEPSEELADKMLKLDVVKDDVYYIQSDVDTEWSEITMRRLGNATVVGHLPRLTEKQAIFLEQERPGYAIYIDYDKVERNPELRQEYTEQFLAKHGLVKELYGDYTNAEMDKRLEEGFEIVTCLEGSLDEKLFTPASVILKREEGGKVETVKISCEFDRECILPEAGYFVSETGKKTIEIYTPDEAELLFKTLAKGEGIIAWQAGPTAPDGDRYYFAITPSDVYNVSYDGVDYSKARFMSKMRRILEKGQTWELGRNGVAAQDTNSIDAPEASTPTKDPEVINRDGDDDGLSH